MHPVRFDSVLSVLEHAGRLRWSLLPAGTLWRTPPQPQAARGCSRAVHKLQEALAALRRAGGARGPSPSPSPARFGTAIDLGARLDLCNNLGSLFPCIWCSSCRRCPFAALRQAGRSGPCAAIALLLTKMSGSDITGGAFARKRPRKHDA